MTTATPTTSNRSSSGDESLEGTIERVVFRNEENGWSVVRLSVPEEGEISAIGPMLGVQPGESVRLTGRWETDRKWGEQFRARECLPVTPATPKGIERYLGSGLIDGIGPRLARKLVAHFGASTLDVIDDDPTRLREVPGIGKVLSGRIAEAWDGQRAIRDVMVFLQGHGIGTGHAVRIWKTFGTDAIRVVRENPYMLAQEVHGIGFPTADRIAQAVGIAADAPQRLAAGLLHVLREATTEGHVFLPLGELQNRASELLDVDDATLAKPLEGLVQSGQVIIQPRDEHGRPRAEVGAEDVGAGSWPPAVYAAPLARAEQELAQRLRALASRPLAPLAIDIDKAIHWYESRSKVTLAAQQREALARAIAGKVLVITGGPGTGKTTLVRGIVSVLAKKSLKIQLAAPTGRAAKRLSEATGHAARTVHRLLEWSPHERAFARGADHPLGADVVVIDEASMLDTTLARDIVRALGDDARLILVGDVDQLPSVGPGRVLGDIIESRAVDVVRLHEVFRQARESLIVTNAHRVRQGRLPLPRPVDDDGDFFYFRREDPEVIRDVVLDLVTTRLPRRFGFDPRTEIQVLSPMQRGPLGAMQLNLDLQSRLNPSGPGIQRGQRVLRTGDRVMQLRNNYDLDVFNGDIGRIEEIDQGERQLVVELEDRSIRYDFADLDQLTLAYAGSIHKSQGSEYPCVVLVLHTQHFVMLQRNLFYTAITRGKRMVVVVGSQRAVRRAVENVDADRRETLLAQRLSGAG